MELLAHRVAHELTGISVAMLALLSQIFSIERRIEGIFAVSRLFKVIRSHREASRTRRQLNRAISNATTPAMRDELIMVAQRNGNVL